MALVVPQSCCRPDPPMTMPGLYLNIVPVERWRKVKQISKPSQEIGLAPLADAKETESEMVLEKSISEQKRNSHCNASLSPPLTCFVYFDGGSIGDLLH